MLNLKKNGLVVMGTAFCICGASSNLMAQSISAKPVRVLVGFAAGSGADITARLVSQQLSEVLGQPVVVDNRPGGAGAVAAELVAKSPK